MKQPLTIPILWGDEERYQNVEPYSIRYRDHDIVVEHGYICDGASVPRMAWWFMPPDGLHRAASLIHDRFYDGQGKVGELNFTRYKCDLMFYELMLQAGVSKSRSLIAYQMVRRFGGAAWESQGDPPVLIKPVHNAHVTRAKKRKSFIFRHLYETRS